MKEYMYMYIKDENVIVNNIRNEERRKNEVRDDNVPNIRLGRME